ncbi:Major cold shock protein [Portunus trituberculatus]|uniref:Major cold shock protein n=1 Tax=Portunus trituberculatus TaxID=210409 RepID=A0A5B7F5T6_PORTR|nr:Major cold shock protein [Portunus trituberculatus]
MASQQHHSQIKRYNFKRGYGFISDFNTKADVFVHFSGLKRSLQKRLPREGDKVNFTISKGDKGLKARDVARTGNNTKACASSPKPPLRTGDMEVKISACICTAKILAGSNVRRLQVLIPLLLKHNGLPVEEVATVEEEEEAEEDEIVDVEDSDSDQPLPIVEPPPADEEGLTTPKKKKNSTSKKNPQLKLNRLPNQPIKPNRPSDPQPSSGKEEEDDGWVTKKKRLPRAKAAIQTLDPPKVPKHRRTTKPSIALRESPTITRLRQVNWTGPVREEVLTGVYIHD